MQLKKNFLKFYFYDLGLFFVFVHQGIYYFTQSVNTSRHWSAIFEGTLMKSFEQLDAWFNRKEENAFFLSIVIYIYY